MSNFSNIDIKHTVCFTGPRPFKLFGYEDCLGYQNITNALVNLLQELQKFGYNNYISGGAQGFDQLAFFAIDKYIDYNQNHVFIPFKEQPNQWWENGLFGQKSYYKMLSKATSVIDISNGQNNMSYREYCKWLLKRNEEMVNHSSITIALWWHDRDYNTEKGGTAFCIRYSKKLGHTTILLDPITCKIKIIK